MALGEGARERMVRDLSAVLDDTEQLVRAVAADTSAKVSELRPKVQAALAQARVRVVELQGALEESARQAAQAADARVRENPWAAVGIAAAVGAGVGAIVTLLLARD